MTSTNQIKRHGNALTVIKSSTNFATSFNIIRFSTAIAIVANIPVPPEI